MNCLAFGIVGHLVGDYLLQNDWMALNKKSSSPICAVHALIWTAAVVTFTGWITPLAVGLLFVTHFLQDRFDFVPRWMRFMGQHKFMLPPMAPWSTIVCDNTWHLVVLALIAKFVV